jgi:hypothetical protein
MRYEIILELPDDWSGEQAEILAQRLKSQELPDDVRVLIIDKSPGGVCEVAQ